MPCCLPEQGCGKGASGGKASLRMKTMNSVKGNEDKEEATESGASSLRGSCGVRSKTKDHYFVLPWHLGETEAALNGLTIGFFSYFAPEDRVCQPSNSPCNLGTRHSSCLSQGKGFQFPISTWNYSNKPITCGYCKACLSQPLVVPSVPRCKPLMALAVNTSFSLILSSSPIFSFFFFLNILFIYLF